MILYNNIFIVSFLHISHLQNTNQVYMRHYITAESFTDTLPVKFQSGDGLIIKSPLWNTSLLGEH